MIFFYLLFSLIFLLVSIGLIVYFVNQNEATKQTKNELMVIFRDACISAKRPIPSYPILVKDGFQWYIEVDGYAIGRFFKEESEGIYRYTFSFTE